MSEKDISEWWDAASGYYQKEISGDKMETVRYGPFGSSEDKLRLLGSVRGRRVLELGCGGGQVSIALAKKGAVCTAIDISKKQLEYAEESAKKKKVSVNFIRQSISDLSGFGSASFDIIISVFALQYVEDLGKVFSEVRRLLRRNGIFVFSIDHPFYITVNPNNMTISESYNKTGMTEEKEIWPDGSRRNFIMYRRRVSDIINSITGSGLKLGGVIEPFDDKDPVWGQGYRRKLVRLITPTMIFKCLK